MKIKEHLPSIGFSYHKPIEVEFLTIDELMNIPFVLKWTRCFFDSEKPSHAFKRFSISHCVDDMHLLMIEYHNDPFLKMPPYWVVGYIKGPLFHIGTLGLPHWDRK